MRLYLARHGDYVLDPVQKLDVLSSQGVDDITRLAGFLRGLNLRLAQVFHSGKHRARQTAELFAKAFAYDQPLEVHTGLMPNDDVLSFAEELEQSEEALLVVGHLPFMSKLVSQLLTGTENKEIVHFQPGTLVCLEKTARGRFHVLWVLSADLMARKGQ
jgi:phosphohistidine phosphatase